MGYYKKIWISGVKGRLGRELYTKLNPLSYQLLATDVEEVDIRNSEEVNLFVERNRPQIIINAAGLTDPKACEENPEEAMLVNGLGARNMAIAARRFHAKLVHISTDDIFGREDQRPYREYDDPKPETIYGKSKYFGEKMVMSFCNTFYIVRSSWLYGKNYPRVQAWIEEAQQTGKIHVARGQFAAPTPASLVADFIARLIETTEYGIYHAVCHGYCSRREFAEKILEYKGISAEVIEAEETFNGVHRPDFTVLDPFLLTISKLYEFPYWEEALKDYMKEAGLIEN